MLTLQPTLGLQGLVNQFSTRVARLLALVLTNDAHLQRCRLVPKLAAATIAAVEAIHRVVAATAIRVAAITTREAARTRRRRVALVLHRAALAARRVPAAAALQTQAEVEDDVRNDFSTTQL